jgi:hypothetical protein
VSGIERRRRRALAGEEQGSKGTSPAKTRTSENSEGSRSNETGHHGRVYGGTLQARTNLTLVTHHPYFANPPRGSPQPRAFIFGHSGSGRPNARWQEEGRGRRITRPDLLHQRAASPPLAFPAIDPILLNPPSTFGICLATNTGNG